MNIELLKDLLLAEESFNLYGLTYYINRLI